MRYQAFSLSFLKIFGLRTCGLESKVLASKAWKESAAQVITERRTVFQRDKRIQNVKCILRVSLSCLLLAYMYFFWPPTLC